MWGSNWVGFRPVCIFLGPYHLAQFLFSPLSLPNKHLGLVWFKKNGHSIFITHHSSLITQFSLLITQTLFFPSLKIKHVWFHFLFYVTQNFAGTHLLCWVRRIYLPTRVSSLSSSFSLFLSSLLCLYSPLR